jgi:peptidyl-prolyl cis-trans isomerase D
MLNYLRKNAKSWVLKLLLLLVALTFILWGGSTLLRDKTVTYAAKVNGTTIHLREYSDAYQDRIKQYRDALGPAFNEKMVTELKLRERLLDEFIYRILLAEEAKKLGLTVSDDELRGMIQSAPAFQADGRFDPRRYESFLRQQRTTAEEFERTQREQIQISRVVNLVRQNVTKVSEQEVWNTFLFENERINLSFIKVSADLLKGQVSANDIDIKDYYDKNQEQFRTPVLAQVQYLAFRTADMEGKVQVSPEEVKQIYEAQKDRFKTPKQVKAREILIKINPQDPPEKVEEKRKKAEEILEKAKKTKDFASLARQASESDTASKGGDLGWVQKGTIDEPSEAALFALKAGETSGLVLRPSGLAIFRAEEVREEKDKSLEEAKEEIVRNFKKEKARALASRKAEDAFYALFRNRDLETYAREKEVPIKTTGLFKESEEVPEFGRDPNFYSSVSSLKVGEISPVVTVGPNFYILKLLDKKESRILPLQEVKGEAGQKVVAKKSEEKARQMAEDLLKQLQGGKDIREVAKAAGLSPGETGPFQRTAGAIPKIGPVKDAANLLAPITDKNPLAKTPFETQEGYFVVRLLTVEPADQKRFPEMSKTIEQRLSSLKQEEFFQRWLDQLKTKAKIDINKDILKS